MAYVRQRGNQLAIVHGERDPEAGKVQQRILFTIYSKAEALKIIGRKDKASARHFQHLLAHEYPGIRFNWNKINNTIEANLDIMPDLYNYKTERLQARFRDDLCAFARQVILTDPQEFFSAAKLMQENQHELEYLVELIQWRLKMRHREQDEWNTDNQFYWRNLLQGNKVPPEAEEHAADYYHRGEYDRAQAVFKLLIECFKDYAEGYNYLGLIALAQAKLDEAISYFDQTMVLGRKLFPPKMAHKHYWTDLSTRPYMRGMKNIILALIRAGRYDEALSFCDRLEKECGDEISAASYRANIYLNTAYWQTAADAAIWGHKLFPSESLIAAFACFELDRYEDALTHFIYGTLNYPRACRILNGQQTPKPKSNEEIRDHNEGVNLSRTLHDFKSKQSRKSKKFFQTLLEQPRIISLIQESEDLADKWQTQNPTPKRNVFDRMQRIRSFEFAQGEAGKLGKEISDIIH
jgi:tetratricopeptide (TPR) repeat protein